MKIRILVIAILWMFSGFLSTAQGQAQIRVCSCVDKEDLLNLLSEAEMSIQRPKINSY